MNKKKSRLRILFTANKNLSAREQKQRRTSWNQTVRILLRAVFFFLMPGSFVAGFSGIKSLFQTIGQGSVLAWNQFFFVLVSLLIFTVLFGRFFCGYVCAFGSLGDFVFWLSGLVQKKVFRRKKQIVIPVSVNPWAQKIKYLVLCVILALCTVGIFSSLSGYSPWTVFSFFLAFRGVSDEYLPGLLILAAIVIGMAFKERFFCQFLCPLGAVFSLLPQLPAAFLKRNPKTCIPGCSACRMRCPVDLKLETDGFRNGECIACERCADICPKQNLSRWDRRLLKHEVLSVLLKAAFFFVLGMLTGLSRI